MHFEIGNCNVVIDENFSSSLKTQNVPHLSVTSGDTVSRLFSFKMSNRPKINRECICSRRHCSDTEIENVYLVWVYLTSRSIVMIVRRTVKMMMMMMKKMKMRNTPTTLEFLVADLTWPESFKVDACSHLCTEHLIFSSRANQAQYINGGAILICLKIIKLQSFHYVIVLLEMPSPTNSTWSKNVAPPKSVLNI